MATIWLNYGKLAQHPVRRIYKTQIATTTTTEQQWKCEHKQLHTKTHRRGAGVRCDIAYKTKFYLCDILRTWCCWLESNKQQQKKNGAKGIHTQTHNRNQMMAINNDLFAHKSTFSLSATLSLSLAHSSSFSASIFNIFALKIVALQFMFRARYESVHNMYTVSVYYTLSMYRENKEWKLTEMIIIFYTHT